MTNLLPISNTVEDRILLIRGQKVMLDSDLAELYGVTTKRLNEQVRRNRDRFPEDFMFKLSQIETGNLRSQFATSNNLFQRSQFATAYNRNIRYSPYAFTEHGAVMLASVLNSKIAVESSLQVVRAFVRLRSILAAHKELAKKLDSHINDTHSNFVVVFDLIKKQLPSKKSKSKKIGYRIR